MIELQKNSGRVNTGVVKTLILEEIKTEICDHYCKYPDIYDTREDSDEELDKMIKEVCGSCPVNRL